MCGTVIDFEGCVDFELPWGGVKCETVIDFEVVAVAASRKCQKCVTVVKKRIRVDR